MITATQAYATPYYFGPISGSFTTFFIQSTDFGTGMQQLDGGLYISADGAGSAPLVAYSK